MTWEQAIPLIAAVLLSIPGIIGLFRGLRKERADTAQAITDAADKLIKQYVVRLDEVEETVREQAAKIVEQDKRSVERDKKIAEQDVEIAHLKSDRMRYLRGVKALCDQIKNLGLIPVWEPNEEDLG